MEKHLISIITPVHNSAQFIEATIDSVLKQTYSHWEMILIDDCSEDGSIAIIEKIMEYDVMSTPAIVIDEKVVIKGRVPSQDEIRNLLKAGCCDDSDSSCCEESVETIPSPCCNETKDQKTDNCC